MYKVVTIELEMSHEQADRYARVHKAALSAGKPSGAGLNGDQVSTGFVDMGIHRRLCFAALHAGLDNFFKSRKVSTANVAGWSDRNDYGHTVFHKLTRSDTLAPAYRSRITAAMSICAPS